MLSPLPVGEGEVGVPRVGPHRSPGHPHPIIGHMDKLGRNFKHAGVPVSTLKHTNGQGYTFQIRLNNFLYITGIDYNIISQGCCVSGFYFSTNITAESNTL